LTAEATTVIGEDVSVSGVTIALELRGGLQSDEEVSSICQSIANRVVVALGVKSLQVHFNITRDGFPWVTDQDRQNVN